jgi:DNA-binding transcriptional regulator YhcF (GntR family)
MEFYIEKHSSTPVARQIEEQIKLGVMMGVFRNGDMLPSIRDIEKQTGINRSQIHKAYVDLRRSGLLVLTRGKGSVITTATDSPRSINDNCHNLSKTIIEKVRRLGISPTAFARYLSRYAQESERRTPFIVYVDTHEEIAVRTAAEISKLWQVSVVGMEFRDVRTLAVKNSSKQKILVNHVMCEDLRSMLPGKKSAVIPVEVRYSAQTMRKLAQIKKDSSILMLVLPQPSHRIHFMTAQMRRLLKSPGIRISSVTIDENTDFEALLNGTDYDYYVAGPGVRGEIPHEMRRNPRVVQLEPKLDPASLEAARIRAGVVI